MASRVRASRLQRARFSRRNALWSAMPRATAGCANWRRRARPQPSRRIRSAWIFRLTGTAGGGLVTIVGAPRAHWTRSSRAAQGHDRPRLPIGPGCGMTGRSRAGAIEPGRTRMPRFVKVAAAQMGPNNEGTSREEIVERMLALMEQAAREDVELIAYPEMALTTYFPKRIRDDFDQFFETEVPPEGAAAPARAGESGADGLPRGVLGEGRRPLLQHRAAHRRDGPARGNLQKDSSAGCHEARRLRAGVRAPLLRDRRYRLQGVPHRQGAGGHRHLPGPALSGVVPVPGHPRRGDRGDRLQHPALPAGAGSQRAVPPRGRLPEQPVRRRHREGRAWRTAWSSSAAPAS